MITLGTRGPIVARWQRIMLTRFSSYALAYDGGPLRVDSYFGQDDLAASLLIPLLGLSVSAAMLTAIVYGLTPDDKWAQRHGAGAAPQPTGWAPVLGVIVALLIGASVLMGTVAFSGQRFFEWQLEHTGRTALATPAFTAARV